MPKATDIRVLDVATDLERHRYRAPMKFGGNVVEDVTILNVTVRARTAAGHEAEGFGSMPLSNVWAWPPRKTPVETSLAVMIELSEQIAECLRHSGVTAHPLDLMTELESEFVRVADGLGDHRRDADATDHRRDADATDWGPTAWGPTAGPAGRLSPAHQSGAAAPPCRRWPPEPVPKLATLVVASPFDAAVFDAFGKANGINSYNGLSAEFVGHDLAHYLNAEFAGAYLDRYTSRLPKDRIPLYHLVGALDPLTDAELPHRLNDGYPETLEEWIAADGLTHLKIKLNGDDLAWDVERVLAVDRVATSATRPTRATPGARGLQGVGFTGDVAERRLTYSLDFNERCPNVEYLLDFLAQIRERSPRALARVAYIEQPTARDLRAHPENKVHRAAAVKPVVIDESLTDFESLLLAREQGYTGVALKACKGQSQALLMAAAAQHYRMFLCVQDLTCPGASFLHSAGLAARIPPVTAIEGNARQYVPAANAGWAGRYPGVFRVVEGTIETRALAGHGLGH